MNSESYKKRVFEIADPNALLREASDLQKPLLKADGTKLTIANGTKITVSEIKRVPSGSKSASFFLLAVDAASGAEFGWTSATNVKGKFLSETIGVIAAPPGGNRFGAHAAWSAGGYVGQIDLVMIVGTGYETEFVAAESCDAFLALVEAARADGREIKLNSGFRTWLEQKHLYNGFKRGLPGFNPANPPGSSNHQSGIAFDLDVKPGPGNPNYDWLAKAGTNFGFVRTVSKESWHWEYLPTKAAKARAAGKHSTF